MTDLPSLIVETPVDGVRRLTVNRPDALNAYDMATTAALIAELERANADPAVRVVVLAATGGRAFSAGFDIREMSAFDAQMMRDAFVLRDPLMRHAATHRCPVIAAIDGICYGAGALLSLACDMRVATPAFRFKVTAGTYGGANATWSLPALIGPGRAKEILMRSRVVEADEALAIGLVNALHPSEELAARTLELAGAIAANPPEGVEGIKQLVDGSIGLTPEQGWQAEHDWMLRSLDTAPGGADVFDGFLAGHQK